MTLMSVSVVMAACLAAGRAAERGCSSNSDSNSNTRSLSPVKRGILRAATGITKATGDTHTATHMDIYTDTDKGTHTVKTTGTPIIKSQRSLSLKSPACAANSSLPWCLEDAEYPSQEIQYAAEHYFHYLLPLYTDVANLNTELSVDPPVNSLEDETYLCPSSTAYVKPLRVVNSEGYWRIVVNNIKLYTDTLTQTTRVEVCLSSGKVCPKVPDCLKSSCREKSVYHRFLVYDPYDRHFPFGIESFKLPSACACYLGASSIPR